MKKTDLAYTAGIVDGEGCIAITLRRPKNKSITYEFTVTVGSTDEWLPIWLKFAFGGYVHKYPPKRGNLPFWVWFIRAGRAKGFLELILPYLHLKKPQAELAIKFQSRKRYYCGKHKPLDIQVLEEADAILLRSMHKRKG